MSHTTSDAGCSAIIPSVQVLYHCTALYPSTDSTETLGESPGAGCFASAKQQIRVIWNRSNWHSGLQRKKKHIPYHSLPNGTPKGICLEQGKATEFSTSLNPNDLCLILDKDTEIRLASFRAPKNIIENSCKSL